MNKSLHDHSFKELKKLLYENQDNPIKERVIRRIMKEKYLEHLRKKREQKQAKDKKEKERIEKEMRKKEKKEVKHEQLGQEFDSFLDDIEKIEAEGKIASHDAQGDFDEYPKEVNYEKRKFDPIQRDTLNNNLMNRLNSDIDIQGYRDIRYKPREIMSAFSEDNESYKNYFDNAIIKKF